MAQGYKIISIDRYVNRRRRVNMCQDLEKILAEYGPHVNLILGLVFERDHGWFKRMHDEMLPELDSIMRQCGFQNIHWVLNSQNYSECHDRNLEMFSRAKTKTYIDYFLVKTYRMMSTQEFNPAWNPNARKMLFLTGKPHKANRGLLLSKFYEKNLLDELEWSFHSDSRMSRIMKQQYFDHYSTEQFEQFMNTCTRNPDQANIWYQFENCHYHGFPFDVNLYKNTMLSIVSETDYYPHTTDWLTEKTWRTIANCHPFVFAGNKPSLDLLVARGYQTFQEYHVHDDHAPDLSIDQRLDMICDNALSLTSSCQKHEQEIAALTRKNHELFMAAGACDYDSLYGIVQHIGDGTLTNELIIDVLSFREHDLAKGIIP